MTIVRPLDDFNQYFKILKLIMENLGESFSFEVVVDLKISISKEDESEYLCKKII